MKRFNIHYASLTLSARINSTVQYCAGTLIAHSIIEPPKSFLGWPVAWDRSMSAEQITTLKKEIKRLRRVLRKIEKFAASEDENCGGHVGERFGEIAKDCHSALETNV